MSVQIKEPYAGQVFTLNEDNEFECDHQMHLEHDSFDHDWNGGGTQGVTWVECEFGCDIPDHIADAFMENVYG
ncbi:hypothetical protein DRQ25_18550 [Candidatus Fermentibacteria bacterium]|nr:MAG: hypothetical protein DRQ25_18550 [Candidatus Fermentibacteria bacterium]